MEVEVFKVDGKEAMKTIGELKQELKDARKALDDAVIGSEEYNEAIKEVADLQSELKDAVSKSTLSFEEATEQIDTTGKSYNDLVGIMSDLQKAYKATSDEAQRSAIGKNISSVNDKLKSLDEKVGNYKRNVGNYQQAVSILGTAFPKLAAGLGAASKATTAFGLALKGAGIGVILTVVQALIEGFKLLAEKINLTDAASNSLAGIMSLMQPIFDSINNVISKLVETIESMIKEMLEFIADLTILPDKLRNMAKASLEAMEANKKLAEQEGNLRDAEVELKEAMAEHDKLLSTIEDTSKSATERTEALTKAYNVQKTAFDKLIATEEEMLKIQQESAKHREKTSEDLEKERQIREKIADLKSREGKLDQEYITKYNSINNVTISNLKQEQELFTENGKIQLQTYERNVKLLTNLTKQYSVLHAGAADFLSTQTSLAEQYRYATDYFNTMKDMVTIQKQLGLISDETYKSQISDLREIYNILQYNLDPKQAVKQLDELGVSVQAWSTVQAQAYLKIYQESKVALEKLVKEQKITPEVAYDYLKSLTSEIKDKYGALTKDIVAFNKEFIEKPFLEQFNTISEELEILANQSVQDIEHIVQKTDIGTSLVEVGKAIGLTDEEIIVNSYKMINQLDEQNAKITSGLQELETSFDSLKNTYAKSNEDLQTVYDNLNKITQNEVAKRNELQEQLKTASDDMKSQILSDITFVEDTIESLSRQMNDAQFQMQKNKDDELTAYVQMTNQKMELDKKASDNEQKMQKLRSRIIKQNTAAMVDQYTTAGANISELVATINSESESAFNVQKGFQIAQATMQTYQSATGAYSAMSGIPIVGPALGAAAAAAAVAAGLLNIREIAKTSFDSSGSSSSSSSSPTTVNGYMQSVQSGQTVNTGVSTTTVPTSTSTTDSAQTSTVSKVYITKTDLEDALKTDVTQYSL